MNFQNYFCHYLPYFSIYPEYSFPKWHFFQILGHCVLVVAVNISGFDFFLRVQKMKNCNDFRNIMGKKSSAIFFVFLVIWTDKFFQWFGMKKLYSIFIRNFFSSIPINSISSPSMKLIYDHSGMRCIFARYKQNLLVYFFSGTV